MPDSLPRLGVVVDLAGVGPNDIAAAALGVCDLVFVCDRSLPYVQRHLDLLHAFGEVCDITGRDADSAAAELRTRSLSGLTTFSEPRLRLTASLAARTGNPFHSERTATMLTDKFEQRQALGAAGVDTTRSRIVRGAEDLPAALAATGLPVVVKPRRGAGSRDTCRADTPQAAAAALDLFAADLAEGAELVVETMLTGDPGAAGTRWGDYVSVESVLSTQGPRHVCVTGKFALAEPFRETGMFLPSTLRASARDEVTELATAALAALDVRHGVTHTEIKLTPDGPRIIEVNGRVGGYVPEILQRATGFDLAGAAVRAALGQPVEAPPLSFDRVTFQYLLTAAAGRDRVRAVTGTDRLRDVNGIDYVDVRARPGTDVSWRLGTEGRIGTVYGRVPDHAALAGLVDVIESTVTIDYE